MTWALKDEYWTPLQASHSAIEIVTVSFFTLTSTFVGFTFSPTARSRASALTVPARNLLYTLICPFSYFTGMFEILPWPKVHLSGVFAGNDRMPAFFTVSTVSGLYCAESWSFNEGAAAARGS